jgi:hypothetical protein
MLAAVAMAAKKVGLTSSSECLRSSPPRVEIEGWQRRMLRLVASKAETAFMSKALPRKP